MRSQRPVLISFAGLSVWLLVVGFLIFAAFAMRSPDPETPRADGIVVLTGADQRIREGARLLAAGRAGRLLISGVNRHARREDVQKLSGLPEDKFGCCVDLGYQAQDTVGNAEEARAWAEERHFTSLIVVTSSYHMPRSLGEIALALPGARLYAHAVAANLGPGDPWWLHARTTRVLIGEYLKFLPVAARLTAAKLMRPWANNALAETSASGQRSARD